MDYFWIPVLAGITVGVVIYWEHQRNIRRKLHQLDTCISGLLRCNSEMKETIVHGLIKRYEKNADSTETPLDFENFVARILESCHGGRTYVTATSSDYGVDIEHKREGKLYLGQVKCYARQNKVGYEPVAIIHSQMVKQKAAGGFVITTSDFSPNAREYAQGLGIELVDGEALVDIWMNAVEAEKVQGAKLVPTPQES